jgi:hypothetical protein
MQYFLYRSIITSAQLLLQDQFAHINSEGRSTREIDAFRMKHSLASEI